ncbi:hypothetical protein ACU5AX_01215 [Sphingomonas sp. XXL09]|uniref:hypothetical protein n=1 Tax=Sphingomonas sp. XXL09 TaxID=3457787 RepID=UPI00406BBE51
MRVLLPLVLLVAPPALAQSAKPAKPPPRQCERPQASQVGSRTPKAKPRKLGEMPMAQAFYAVLREIDGCPQNVAVREMPKR